MTRRLFALLIGLALSTGFILAAPASFESEYAGGTVVTIPVNAKGKLDLSDDNELQFHYGDTTYRTPYSKITSIEVADDAAGGGWPGKVSRFVPFMRKKNVVSVGFQGDDGRSETIQLELARNVSDVVVPLLESKSGKRAAGTAEGAPSATAQSSAAAREAWWGDRYWKTTRNSEVWDKKK
jgi:hypothetical protein